VAFGGAFLVEGENMDRIFNYLNQKSRETRVRYFNRSIAIECAECNSVIEIALGISGD
jgi:hypothetical protein